MKISPTIANATKNQPLISGGVPTMRASLPVCAALGAAFAAADGG